MFFPNSLGAHALTLARARMHGLGGPARPPRLTPSQRKIAPSHACLTLLPQTNKILPPRPGAISKLQEPTMARALWFAFRPSGQNSSETQRTASLAVELQSATAAGAWRKARRGFSLARQVSLRGRPPVSVLITGRIHFISSSGPSQSTGVGSGATSICTHSPWSL